MSAVEKAGESAGLMDGIYRHQRHIYDASRKFYLLGRDGLIAGLRPPAGGAVLEIGCGTGRNLIKIAKRCPGIACYGLDVSAEMLLTARRNIMQAGLSDRITLAQADATCFDPATLFGRESFERIVMSYVLSMIPPWREVVARAIGTLSADGSLHIVDFGDQHALPGPFRAVLNSWLAQFHVTPRRDLVAVVAELAAAAGAQGEVTSLYRGYAAEAVIRRI